MPQSTTMGDEERSLRRELEQTITTLRSTMNRIPNDVDVTDDAVRHALEGALQSLSSAESITLGFASLSDLSVEGAMLASNASMALQSIRHSLALLFAELDASTAA